MQSNSNAEDFAVESKQIQKAGDGSQQVQMVNPTFLIGIDEKRVREVCSEIAFDTIKQCTQEASNIAMERIEKFTMDLVPRMERIESDFKSFSEPSFQFELRNAQKVAASTNRESDYELLSELLVHRVEHSDERMIKASIAKAIEIVDQIDDDALCALTLVYAINNWTAVSGNITQGLDTMNKLFSSICYRELPNRFEWVYHLDILNVVRCNSISTFKKFSEYYPICFEGYSCVGIPKNTEIYQKAETLLKEANLPTTVLIEHELNKEYVRLNVRNRNSIKDMRIPIFVEPNTVLLRNLSEEEINVLNSIWDLYSNDAKLKEEFKKAFMEKWDSFDTLKSVRLWWESLPNSIVITPVGKVLAHANAQKYNKQVPDIKF